MDLVIRSAYVFVLILLVTRVVGRRELASLSPFDLILLIVIGDLVQNGVTENDQSITGMTIVILTLAVLTVATTFVAIRVRPLRIALEGEPLLLIVDGRIVERNMRREGLTREDIASEARLAEIASLDEVRYAVLETNGKISFLRRADGAGGQNNGRRDRDESSLP
jgi:uncharacterized membrane protein YcaP (DUF421 family)